MSSTSHQHHTRSISLPCFLPSDSLAQRAAGGLLRWCHALLPISQALSPVSHIPLPISHVPSPAFHAPLPISHLLIPSSCVLYHWVWYYMFGRQGSAGTCLLRRYVPDVWMTRSLTRVTILLRGWTSSARLALLREVHPSLCRLPLRGRGARGTAG